MNIKNKILRTVPVLGMSLCMVLAIGGLPAEADDTDLFRTGSAKPYLFVFFDTSSSVNNLPGDQEPGAGNGDDPGSIFYQSKKVFFEVFNDVYQQHGDAVHYAFGSYNKDQTKIRSKHWVYQIAPGSGALDIGGESYPNADDLLVLGAHFPAGVVGRQPTFGGGGSEGPEQGNANGLTATSAGVLGSCSAPADLASQRVHINRFPKLHPVAAVAGDAFSGVGSMAPTTLFIEQGGTTYELVVSPQTGLVGDSGLTANLVLTPCGGGTPSSAQVTLTKVQEFLYHEQVDDGGFNLESNKHEMTNGYWEYQDTSAAAACGTANGPHTGYGWETNYDGYFAGDLGIPANENPVSPISTEVDSFGAAPECLPGSTQRKTDCNLRQETVVYDTVHACFDSAAPEWRSRDEGDLIPFDWVATNRDDFFKRLAPNWFEGVAPSDLRFDAASYFTDVPAADGYLRLKNPALKPLLAYGASTIGDALTDFRCWYAGSDASGNKCRQSTQPFGKGWKELAGACDADLGCSKIYQIIITDGENNCAGENPASATANLKAKHVIESWVINFGGPQGSDLAPLAQNTNGEYLEVEDGDELKAELERIAGIILEDTRQFASAAAPQVQADDNDKVFNASFNPVSDPSSVTPAAGMWPGRLNAFLKPVPLVDGVPDTSFSCSSDPSVAPRANCHLWDAGAEVVEQSAGLGLAENQRRVFYGRAGPAGQGSTLRRSLAPTSGATPENVRYDLWRGLGLISGTTPDDDLLTQPQETTLETNANTALASLYAIKTFDPDAGTTGDEFDFVFGDIFHSEPLVIDQPESVTYFRQNLFSDPGATDCDSNPGYRCFFFKHQNRRKVMFFGANDGLLHAVDGGIPRPVGHPFEGRYDDGSGREIFAFAPRITLPTIYSQHSGGPRQWSVDASPNASDVFIDAVDNGVFPDPDDREWRTILVTGLRRGGRGYFALDVTQPDEYDPDGVPDPEGGAIDYVPSCIDAASFDPGACGPVPYATPLWEFTDAAYVATSDPNVMPDRWVPFDEDGNGVPDLGSSWSDPVLGLMQVCIGTNCDPKAEPNDVEVRSVAVVGGGFNGAGTAGDWVYIIDIETGEAIYKQRLCSEGTSGATCQSAGAAPAEPAVVDIDGDGFIDRIYQGTRAGYMLRADLKDSSGNVPALSLFVADTLELGVSPMVSRITNQDFAPREIFRASVAGNTPIASRQIFFRPAAGFLSDLGQYALAFGTGNRFNLFAEDDEPGRFYVVRDNIAIGDYATRYSEDDLVTVVDGGAGTGLDTLAESSPKQGWVLLTRPDDRLISTPFQVAGITVFTMFDPEVQNLGTGGNGNGGGGDPLCRKTGTSRVFAVNTRNSDGLLFAGGVRTRGTDIVGFAVTPSLERAGTQNVYDPTDPASGSTRPDDPTDPQNLVACEDNPDCVLALDEMKKLQPNNCKYGSQRHNLPLTTDLLVKVGEIPIPICVIDKNWTEL